MQGGYFINSVVLHGIAKAAYRRTENAPSETAGGQNDALVAVLFSTASLEAFAMQLALYAHMAAATLSKPQYLGALGDVLDEVERFQGSVRLKYLIAKLLVSGQAYDKGAQPYQDLDLLFKIRDQIVHPKPEKIGHDPSVVKALEAKGLVEKAKPRVYSSWFGRISTRAVARWACNVVFDLIDSLRAAFPVQDKPESILNIDMFWTDFDRVK